MREWRIEGSFGLENLRLAHSAAREPGPHEVLVDVRAVALNYRDLLIVRGQYDPRLALPHVPCSDCAGVVRAVGSAVTRVAVGDEVLSVFAPRWTAGAPDGPKLRHALGGALPGVLAEQVVLHEEGVVAKPSHLSFAQASTLPCAGVTAWHALVDHGGVKAGQRVLVQGSGGVSIFALQIALLHGARVIATSSRADKRERLAQLGAQRVLDYVAEPAWGKAVRGWAEGQGVDHVVEVGGAGTLSQSLRAVRAGGCVHVIGVLSGTREPLDVLPILMNEVRLQGIMVGPRSSLEALCAAYASAKLEPIVDRSFAMADAREAFAHLASGEHFGKVVVTLA